MKALQITGYGDLKAHLAINEVEKPSVSDHQVLIEIYAASTNPISPPTHQAPSPNLLP